MMMMMMIDRESAKEASNRKRNAAKKPSQAMCTYAPLCLLLQCLLPVGASNPNASAREPLPWSLGFATLFVAGKTRLSFLPLLRRRVLQSWRYTAHNKGSTRDGGFFQA